jgi:hypothetical protein
MHLSDLAERVGSHVTHGLAEHIGSHVTHGLAEHIGSDDLLGEFWRENHFDVESEADQGKTCLKNVQRPVFLSNKFPNCASETAKARSFLAAKIYCCHL